MYDGGEHSATPRQYLKPPRRFGSYTPRNLLTPGCAPDQCSSRSGEATPREYSPLLRGSARRCERSPQRSDLSPTRTPRKGDLSPTRTPRKGDFSPRSTPRKCDLSPRSTPRKCDLSSRSTPRKGEFSPTRTPRKGDLSPARTPRRGDRSSRKDDRSPTRAPRKGDLSPTRTPRKNNPSPQFHLTPPDDAYPVGPNGLKRRIPPTSKRAVEGKRRALLVGINYVGQMAPLGNDEDVSIELDGCREDAFRLKKLLLGNGFLEQDIRVLIDSPQSEMQPLRKNVIKSMRWLVSDAAPGDTFFFSFSGHGTQEEDIHGIEEDGMNETILPVDWLSTGSICDDEINDILVRPLPNGCKLTGCIDACHSGTALDLPFQWKGDDWKVDTNPLYVCGDVVLFSGCKDSEISLEGRKGGAMTEAFIGVLKKNKHLTYVKLFDLLNKALRRGGFTQRPMMTSSQKFAKNRPFSLGNNDQYANGNKKLGSNGGGLFGCARGLFSGAVASSKKP